MNIVFAHDHKFREYEEEFYSTGGLSDSVLSRYVEIFGNVTVVARIIKKQQGDRNLSKIINKNVRIINSGWKGKKKLILEKEIKECDAVIARLPSFIGNKAIYYAKKYNKPYLIEVVGCAWDSMWNHSKLGKIIAPYMFYKTRKNVKNSEFSLYVTNDFLQKRYPTNGISISCSDVVLAEHKEEVLQKRIENINVKKDKCIIGTIAAVDVKYKGQESIIRALAKLNKDSAIKYEYHLVGGGDNTYLKTIAKKYGVLEEVKFLGTIPHEEIFDWLDSIDIYAQPSKVEGLPRALVEAMSRSIPCLATNVGGMPELLSSKFLFSKKRNIDEICKILKKFNKNVLEEQARDNFNKSKLYNKNLIEEKRNNFFKEFREYAMKNKCN